MTLGKVIVEQWRHRYLHPIGSDKRKILVKPVAAGSRESIVAAKEENPHVSRQFGSLDTWAFAFVVGSDVLSRQDSVKGARLCRGAISKCGSEPPVCRGPPSVTAYRGQGWH